MIADSLKSLMGIFMAWKGGEDQGIWTADTAYPSDNNLFLDPQRNIPNIGTSVSPSLAVFGNRLFMAWKGVEGDQGVWTSSFVVIGPNFPLKIPFLNARH
jgi:hypothetical protein